MSERHIPGSLMISAFTESGEAVPGGIRKGVTIQVSDDTNRRLFEVDVDFESFGKTAVAHTDVPCRIAMGWNGDGSNARLIAAAPELLALVRACRVELDYINDSKLIARDLDPAIDRIDRLLLRVAGRA